MNKKFIWGVNITKQTAKHYIQYFERVGSFQNNIGHLDT